MDKKTVRWIVEKSNHLSFIIEDLKEKERIKKRELENYLLENYPFCSCGEKLIPHYEGGIICPAEEKGKIGAHKSEAIYSDLAIFNFCVDFLGVNTDRLKEIKKSRGWE